MGRRRSWQAAVAVLAAAIVGVVAYRVVSSSGNGSPTGSVGTDHLARIPVPGATLSAEVVTPRHRPGKAPLVVMPASWGQPATEYRAVAARFAAAGYVVVAYAQRGFPASTGAVDLAGPATQRDVPAVIDWALAHTAADAKRIGMFGISYGGGMSLLGAALDPRVRAVAALSTWTDEGASFDPNGTPSTAALGALIGSRHSTVRFAPDVQHLQDVLHHDPKAVGAAIRAISAARSPDSEITALNRNRPAILIANAYQDSIFPPAQLVPFFDSLTTPKRLQLAAGDHGGPELSALYGHDNETVDDARAWFDHYLRGTANGIDTEGPIVLHDARTGALRTYRSWPTAGSGDGYPLGRPNAAVPTGAATTWQAHVTAGIDSGAGSGKPQYLSLNAYRSPQLALRDLKAGAALLWDGPALPSQLVVSGTPAVQLNLSSTSRTTTVFAYLYDVDKGGVARLMTMAPYTVTGLSAKAATPVTIPLQPTSWTVPGGDRVALVLDTVDERYTALTTRGAIVTVSSSAAHPARMTIPTPTG